MLLQWLCKWDRMFFPGSRQRGSVGSSSKNDALSCCQSAILRLPILDRLSSGTFHFTVTARAHKCDPHHCAASCRLRLCLQERWPPEILPNRAARPG